MLSNITEPRSMPVEQPQAAVLNGSLTHLLHRACQVADSIFNEEAGKTGLTTRQYAVLVAVANNRDISQTGLVAITGIDRSTVAEIVKRLLRRGVIKRKRTRLDARAYAVRLTEEGETLLREAEPAASRAELRIRALVEGRDVNALAAVLAQLADGLPGSK
ncbi:MAG: MarR family transcriptional regulator [Proteobacteria bacterium]|nr:MarR family transcriptional regulator [Pseudomonadota bacterium]